jgi:hypothetical protein
MSEIGLGDKVRCKISGATGTVTDRTESLFITETALRVMSRTNENGVVSWFTASENSFELIEKYNESE